MTVYNVTFSGVTRGAIGASQKFSVIVEALNTEDARLKLYDEYDHIMLPVFEVIAYKVLLINGQSFNFTNHEKAFEFCSNSEYLVKGVYKVINKNTLGALNIWANSFKGELFDLESKFPQFIFKVI